MVTPVKADDADSKWTGYPGHTQAKHRLLQYYSDIWLRKLLKPGPKVRIFDCFAGRGEYYHESDKKPKSEPLALENISTAAEWPGSPQYILDMAVERAKSGGEIECVFLEKKEKNIRLLRENLPAQSELPSNVSYRVDQGKFQNQTRNLIRETGGWNHPTFFFIDPFGYKDLDYDLITNISSTKGFEVLITLMASEVVRWQDAEKHQQNLTTMFGTRSWHKELEKFEPGPDNVEDKEAGYYCTRLEKNGPEHVLAYLVTEENSRRMKYYLVFGTNHDHGLEKMRESMQNCGPGRFAYAPKRSEQAKGQMSIAAATRKQKQKQLEKDLQERFEGRELAFDDLVQICIKENTYEADYRRQNIRTALKSLEEQGEINVSRVTSETSRGLGGNDQVLFSGP